MKSKISASIMCADPLAMRKELDFLEEKGVDYFHCDVMDGHFVPNLMLSTEIVKAVKQHYHTPLDLHFMVKKPENILPWFPFGEGDVVSIHYESTPHVCRVLDLIRQRGATPALALNPATPLECAREVAESIGMLLVMTVNPGFAAQKMVPGALDKIRRARILLAEWGCADLPIEVDGNCNYEHIPQMEEAGANLFVTGSSSIFSAALGIEAGWEKTCACLARRYENNQKGKS